MKEQMDPNAAATGSPTSTPAKVVSTQEITIPSDPPSARAPTPTLRFGFSNLILLP